MRSNLGIYIHIPFCEQKCNYCGFLSFTNQSDAIIEEYVQYLIKEIKHNSKALKDKYYVESIYIGGGTPSILHHTQIERILDSIKENYIVTQYAEISIESNPNTLDEIKLFAYKKMGINRISVGIQSTNDKTLKTLGRVHNKKIALSALELIENSGIDDYSVDLMFGIPGQKKDEIIESIKDVEAFNPSHISMYRLQLEENTPFYTSYKNEVLDLIDDKICEEEYINATEFLKTLGYEQYEISNFSKPNYQCLHNIKYWTMAEFLGIGLNASSFLMGHRGQNLSSFKKYKEQIDLGGAALDLDKLHKETLEEAYGIYVFTRLRMNQGIDLEIFEQDFNISFFEVYKDKINYIKEQEQLGNLIFNEKQLALTQKGFLQSNNIMCEFIKE